MGAPDILALDATAQLQAMEGKRISAFELLEACQGALNSRNVRLNAVVAADFERAQDRARAIDDLRARGIGLGPLAGLPMTVKDSFDVEGLPASIGAEAAPTRQAADAWAVARVRAAGAVLWGKTNAPTRDRDWQTQGGLYGVANNPWDVDRTPGGSSGGSAAAVAAGLAPLDIGSDSAGGLRLPASFCGVYAHRPTFGLVDNRGHVPPAPGAAAERDILTAGPLARSPRDLRLLLAAMTDAPLPAKAEPAALARLKVGLWLDEPAFTLDGEVRAALETFADSLRSQGAQVRPIPTPIEPRALVALLADLLMAAEAQDLPAGRYGWERRGRGPAKLARALGAGPWSWAGEALGHTLSHRSWLAADEARARLKLQVRAMFEGVDVVIAPSAPIAAFPHQKPGKPLRLSNGRTAAYASLGAWNALASVCGLPATAAPAGVTPGGLPVGVQIIGPRGADSRTLAVAQAIEASVWSFVRPPGPQDL